MPLLIALLIGLCWFVHLGAEPHRFTNLQGDSIEAEVLAYDGEYVRIRRSDGQEFDLFATDFIRADQRYLEQWLLRAGRALGPERGPVRAVVRDPKHREAVEQINAILAAHYYEKGLEPEPILGDAEFLRRACLTLVGRNPSYAQVEAFLADKSSDKRAKLIDSLLDSEGYVSHQFNYWADLLRVQSGNERAGGLYYARWLKNALRANIAYDVLVEALLSARGYPWEDGASAYYLRDSGMPLDNMSVTARIFLGTRLECAQCHDHPFDRWSRLDYYQMAAFTYGVKTSVGVRQVEPLKPLIEQLKSDGKLGGLLYGLREVVDPLRWQVYHSQDKLTIPGDWQYENARPNAAIAPKTIYGKVSVPHKLAGSPRVHRLVDWMVSRENTHFNLTIANRSWKRLMGAGLIEPIDEIRGVEQAAVPELMSYLLELLLELDYDLKQFQRILCNTDLFQRQAIARSETELASFPFTGPRLRRLSAEQVWDSMMGLLLDDLDARVGIDRFDPRSAAPILAELEGMSRDQLERFSRKLSGSWERYARESEEFRKWRAAHPDASWERESKQRKALDKASAQWRELVDRYRYGPGMMMMEMAGADSKRSKKGPDTSGWLRASELPSPAPEGHFLQVFGQSDREVPENAEVNASVLQALTLLNSPMTNAWMLEESQLLKDLRRASGSREKLNVLYRSTLSREPDAAERSKLMPILDKLGGRGQQRVLWALLNSREFLFMP